MEVKELATVKIDDVPEDLLSSEFRMVTFNLGDKAYAIDIMQVKEISSVNRFTYVPNTQKYMRGVFNLRGEIVPVLDMRLFFHLNVSQGRQKSHAVLPSSQKLKKQEAVYENLIILALDFCNLGIIVDSINHVVSIKRTAIQKSHPLFQQLDVQYIHGIVDYNEQLYIILAIDQIFKPELDLADQASPDWERQLAVVSKGLPTEPVNNQSFTQKFGSSDAVPQSMSLSLETIRQQQSPSVARNDEGSIESTLKEQEVLSEKSESQSVTEALKKEGYVVSSINADSVKSKWAEWRTSRKIEVSNADILGFVLNRLDFMAQLRSNYAQEYWPLLYAQALWQYFDGYTGRLAVWHIGCGDGKETYSIAAALQIVAPESFMDVHAADADLLEVAKAPLQSVQDPQDLPEWLRPFLSLEPGKQGYCFKKELKDRIIFEYQDVIHSKVRGQNDVIVIRDVLSQYSEVDQKHILDTISHALKTLGLVIVGDNEELDMSAWKLIEKEPLKIYRRRVR